MGRQELCGDDALYAEPAQSATVKSDIALEREMVEHQPSGTPHRNDGHQATTSGTSDLRGTLRQMEERLRRHSALEDLGPLFGPEAQGRVPSAQPAPPSRQK